MNFNFQLLPQDLQKYILHTLGSFERSKICSVSKLFNVLSVSVSKEASELFHLYDRLNLTLTRKEIKKILIQGDYHLIVRLKIKELINLWCACRGGHLQVIELLIQKGVNDWNRGLCGACRGGHLPIVELMIQKGATLNHRLYHACRGGHLKIIELAIQKGAIDWDNGFYGACRGGHLPIIELMIQKGGVDHRLYWNWGLYWACRGGHFQIIELAIQKGANNWNRGLSGACKGRHLSIVKLMVRKGANSCECGNSIDDH